MTYFVGQTITIPQTDDWEAHTAEITEIVDDVLCVMTEHGEYGEIEIEALEEMLEAIPYVPPAGLLTGFL